MGSWEQFGKLKDIRSEMAHNSFYQAFYFVFENGRCLRLVESGLKESSLPGSTSPVRELVSVLGEELQEVRSDGRFEYALGMSSGRWLHFGTIRGTQEPGNELVLCACDDHSDMSPVPLLQ